MKTRGVVLLGLGWLMMLAGVVFFAHDRFDSYAPRVLSPWSFIAPGLALVIAGLVFLVGDDE